MTTQKIDFGPFRLETEPDRLLRGQEEIALSPKGLGVLAYLARRARRLVTKEELREQVWRKPHVSDTRLRVTVGEIRAALGDDQKSPRYLETVPARGYRFVADAGADIEAEPGAVVEWPWRDEEAVFVGRQREVESLLNRFLKARKGQRQLLFLGGEAGIGKTTVVQLLLDRLAERPRTLCVVGQCMMRYSEGEAYGPVLEALGRLGQTSRGKALVKLLERYAPMWLAQLPALVDGPQLERLQRQVQGSSPERMVRELNDALERLTVDLDLVLVLEDLHWSDVATVELLAAIAQRPEPARLMILGTYRPAEAVVMAPVLRNALRELAGRGLCENFDLELLTHGDVVSFLTARLGSAPSEELANLVFERCDGNALFMVNVLEHLAQARAIRRHRGRWSLDQASTHEVQIPRGLRPFVRRRLDALSAQEREVLDVASVIGVEFAAATLEPEETERIETLLEKLVTRTHLIESAGVADWPDGTFTAIYRFRHALYREGLYEKIAPARRVRLHRTVGERLQKAFGESPDLAAILAVHFEEGRAFEAAARYRRLAGERALGRHAYHEAIAQLRGALDAFDKLSAASGRNASSGDPVRWELDVCTTLATTLIATRGYADPEVKAINLRAQTLAKHLEPEQQSPVLYNLWIYWAVAGELRKAHDVVEQMSGLTEHAEGVELRLMTSCARAQNAFYRADFPIAASAARDVHRLYNRHEHAHLAQRYGQDDPAVACGGQEAWRLWLTGSPRQAVAQGEEAIRLADRLGDPYARTLARFYAAIPHQFRGDVEEVSRRADALGALATEQGFELWVAWAGILQGWIQTTRGDGEGLCLIESCLAAYRETGAGLLRPYIQGILGEAYLAFGRSEDAGRCVAEALAQIETGDERWWQAELYRLEGEISAARGDDPDPSTRRALATARQQGAASLELRAALSLSQRRPSDRRARAHRRLGEIVAGFTEGHSSADLKAAQAHLTRLQQPDATG